MKSEYDANELFEIVQPLVDAEFAHGVLFAVAEACQAHAEELEANWPGGRHAAPYWRATGKRVGQLALKLKTEQRLIDETLDLKV